MTTDLKTPDDILLAIRQSQTAIAEHQNIIAACKTELATLRDTGIIEDKYTNAEAGITASWETRKTWKYSGAVKQLQELEQAEGIATQSESGSWVIRESKKSEDLDW